MEGTNGSTVFRYQGSHIFMSQEEKKMKKVLSLIIALVMAFAMMSVAAADSTTFTGVGDGKNGAGSIEVEVDITSEGDVLEVRVTKNGDDAGICDAAVNTIPGLIVGARRKPLKRKRAKTLKRLMTSSSWAAAERA